MQTIALAYSGGLDTSIIVPWLREHYDARRDLCGRRRGAGRGGAARRAREGARLGRGRVLRGGPAAGVRRVSSSTRRSAPARSTTGSTSSARRWRGRSSRVGRSTSRGEVGADALAHGCTGKGNDQVRFELTYMAFAPDLKVIAPWRELGRSGAARMRSPTRPARNIPVAATAKKIYSRDRNLWHISHEGGVLEDPNQAPPEDLFILTTDPEDAPDRPSTWRSGSSTGRRCR